MNHQLFDEEIINMKMLFDDDELEFDFLKSLLNPPEAVPSLVTPEARPSLVNPEAGPSKEQISKSDRNKMHQRTHREKRVNRENSIFNQLQSCEYKLKITERVLNQVLNHHEADKEEIRNKLTSLLKEVIDENDKLHEELKKFRN